MLLRIIAFGLILSCGMTACKSDKENTETTEAGDGSETPAVIGSPTAAGNAQIQGQPQGDALRSIEIEIMRNLYENCNSLDIIFYDKNFSLSQTEQSQIQTTLMYLGPTPIQKNPDCKPIGRVTFWIDGELAEEADIYVGDNCNYFIWIQDGKEAHINPLSPQGIQFFTKIVTQGDELVPQGN